MMMLTARPTITKLEKKYILKNSVQEHYLFMEEGGAKDINLLMKLFENNIQDHDLSFKQRQLKPIIN